MKLRRFKVKRTRALKTLLEDLIPIVWCADEEGHYKLIDMETWFNFFESNLSELIHGYYDAYTFEDEHFVKYTDVEKFLKELKE
jgi:hypothetical protein